MIEWNCDTCNCILEFGDKLPNDITTSTVKRKTVWTNLRGQSVFEEIWRDQTKRTLSLFEQDGKKYKGYLIPDIDGNFIPHSNFKVINLPNESINFKSAKRICNVHSNLTGKALAEAVINNNKKINNDNPLSEFTARMKMFKGDLLESKKSLIMNPCPDTEAWFKAKDDLVNLKRQVKLKS